MVLAWIKRLLHRSFPGRAADGGAVAGEGEGRATSTSKAGPVWCVVANVVMERGYGPGGAEKRRGTKHFAPGAKVFVFEFFWGAGGETVTVIGRHRKSHRFIRLSMRAKHLANWRAELVYSPYVVRQVHESSEFGGLPADSDRARLRAEEIAASYMKKGAQSQPFVTRPPAGKQSTRDGGVAGQSGSQD